MRITMAITVAGGEGLTRDYAQLWPQVWLVVAVWILVSCRGKIEGRNKGRGEEKRWTEVGASSG